MRTLIRLHHQRDFFSKLQKIDAVLWVSIDDFLTFDVREIILEDFLREQIN